MSHSRKSSKLVSQIGQKYGNLGAHDSRLTSEVRTVWWSWNRTIRLGTWNHSLLIEITHLVSWLNEVWVLDVSSQKEFSEGQSDEKRIYLERYTFHRQNTVCLKRWEWPWETRTPQTESGPSWETLRYEAVIFTAGWFRRLMSERVILTIGRRGRDF